MSARGVALALALCAGVAQAQPVETARRRCTSGHQALLPGDLDGIDSAAAPVMVALPDGAVVAWRTTARALRVARVDLQSRRVGAVREIAAPVGSYAVARGREGVVLAYVEHEREVVLARLSLTLESQNVPRVLHRAASDVGEVSVAALRDGALVTWDEPAGHAVRVRATDLRGVPRAEVVTAGEGSHPRWWTAPDNGTELLRVEPGGAQTDAAMWTVDHEGAVQTRARWPSGAAGPVTLGDALYTVQSPTTGDPMLLRIPVTGPGALIDPAQSPAHQIDALASDGAQVALLATDARAQRLTVWRLTTDGSASALGTVRGWFAGPQSVTVRGDAVEVITRDVGPHGAVHPGVVRIECPR